MKCIVTTIDGVEYFNNVMNIKACVTVEPDGNTKHQTKISYLNIQKFITENVSVEKGKYFEDNEIFKIELFTRD